jgi:hypothetical protein
MDACYDQGERLESLRTIYVVRRGWHTGVVVAKQDWPNREWALLEEFPDSAYLEFGWGDERFYQAEKNTFWLGMRAALWPTSSVVHVIGIREPTADDVRADEIVAVRVPITGLRTLTHAIEREFAGARPVRTGVSASGMPVPNWFYEAKRSFYFPRMCNWWIASRLAEAGCPIRPWSVIAASRVMREAREFAREPHGPYEASH